MKLKFLLPIPALAIVLGVAASAHGQAVKVGNTFTVIPATTRGSSVAYDSTNNVYLVVSSFGALNGRFVGADGTPLGAQFPIQVSTIYTHFPRVAFSPDADGGRGAFLVTWHQSQAGGGTNVFARMVSYPRSGPYTEPAKLNALGLSFWELAGPNIAYGGGQFLVVWQSFPANDIHGARVSNNGALIAPVTISSSPMFERDPSVAFGGGEFLVVYSGYNEAGPWAFVNAQRVSTNGALIGGPMTLTQTGATYVTDVTYNSRTNQFLAAWFNGNSVGRLVAAGGGPVGGVTLLSNRWRAYDAVAVAHNRNTNTFFLVSHSVTAENGGVEIHPTGVPVDNGFIVTNAGGNGNFYPRIAANTDNREWLMTTANNFTSTKAQRIGSGGSVPPPPPPAPPPPGPCTSTVSPTSISVSSGGGTGSVTVSGSCTWTASSSAAWIGITSGASGSGAGTVKLAVAHNATAASRTGTVTVAGKLVTVQQGAATSNPMAAVHDLNGDKRSDLVWQHQATGQVGAWNVVDSTVTATYTISPGPVDASWKVVGVGDMNGDGFADLVWRHMVNGQVAVWYLRGATLLSAARLMNGDSPAAATDQHWQIRGVGDLDGNGTSEIVWQHIGSGDLGAWFVNGANVLSMTLLSMKTTGGWRIAGCGDIDRDGRADILWQNEADGRLGAWLMHGQRVVGTRTLSIEAVTDLTWRLRGVGDTNGDGYADLLWQNTATGDVAVWYLNNFTVTGSDYLSQRVAGGNEWSLVGPG